MGVWEAARITQRSLLNTALRFPVCETKESAVTFVSRWCGTKPLTSKDILAATKSYLWLLIADQGLITLINGSGILGPDLWGLLSVSVQLKRSHRRPEECASPAGAISGLTADTSQMDPVASVQDSMFGESYLILTDHKKNSLSTCGAKALIFPPPLLWTFFCHTQGCSLNYKSVIHNDKVDLAPFATDRGEFCSVSSHCEISPGTFIFQLQ